MSGKIDQHLGELRGWAQDRILSAYELDSFRKLYDRLIDREDAWILETRRLSLSQVTLYLGAWLVVIAAALILLFRYHGLAGTPAVLLVACATGPMAWVGMRCWKRGEARTAIAFLLAFCLLLPTTLLVAMHEWRLLTHFTQGNERLELFEGYLPASTREAAGQLPTFAGVTNAQLWWSILLSMPAFFWLRRHTRASVFSLVLALAGAFLCMVTLLRMGMLEWFRTDPGRVYFRLIPVAVLYFLVGLVIERLRCPADSRYFYPIAVIFTFLALSGVAAFHEPYAKLLERIAPRTRGQLEYLFIINALVYLALQGMSERVGSAQMRSVATWFRFVIPGHVLTSILLLAVAAGSRWNSAIEDASLRHEARFFEILLPIAATLFILGSVPKQMKNFFATGMLFLGIGIARLQLDLFKHRPSWPLAMFLTGTALMILAVNYTPIKLTLVRWFRRKS
jgi:hypothetical protein